MAVRTFRGTEETMNAGTIFVLCLAAGFLIFVIYLAVLSRRTDKAGPDSNERKNGTKAR